jgi:plasmid maintenance system killer protein
MTGGFKVSAPPSFARTLKTLARRHPEFVQLYAEALAVLVAREPRDMGLPGLQLHPLKGERRGTWSVRVSGNWRVTFVFVGGDVDQVDYEDYH